MVEFDLEMDLPSGSELDEKIKAIRCFDLEMLIYVLAATKEEGAEKFIDRMDARAREVTRDAIAALAEKSENTAEQVVALAMVSLNLISTIVGTINYVGMQASMDDLISEGE